MRDIKLLKVEKRQQTVLYYTTYIIIKLSNVVQDFLAIFSLVFELIIRQIAVALLSSSKEASYCLERRRTLVFECISPMNKLN